MQKVIDLWNANGVETKHAVACLTHLFDRSDDVPPLIDQQLFQKHAPDLLPRMLTAVAPAGPGPGIAHTCDAAQRAAIYTALGTFAQHRFGNASDIELQLMDAVLGALDDGSSEVRGVVLPAMGNCAAIYWNLIERPQELTTFFEKAVGKVYTVISNQNPLFLSSHKSMSDALRAFGHLIRLVPNIENVKSVKGESLDLETVTDCLLGRLSKLDNAVKQRCAANAAFALGSIYDSPRDLQGNLPTHIRVMNELSTTVAEAEFARLRVSALAALAHAPASVWERVGYEERMHAWRNLILACKTPLKERKGKFKQVSADQVAQFNRSFAKWMYSLLNVIQKDDVDEIFKVLTILDEGCSSLGVILCLAGPENVKPLINWLQPEVTSSLPPEFVPPGFDCETISPVAHSEDTKSIRDGIVGVLERIQATESFNSTGKM